MQRARSDFNVTKAKSNTYHGSFTDDDSGIGLDRDYSSSSDLNSSVGTLTEFSQRTQWKTTSYPVPETRRIKRPDVTPLIKFPSDGIIERVRPVTMRNSQNGDYILCRTNRGDYIAYRTPVVPAWVTELVHEIDLQQR